MIWAYKRENKQYYFDNIHLAMSFDTFQNRTKI